MLEFPSICKELVIYELNLVRVWTFGGMLLRETKVFGEKPVPANYNHKNSGWNGLVLNPGL